MKLGKLISQLEDIQEELKIFIYNEENDSKYPLHEVFSPHEKYIEFFSLEPIDYQNEKEAITVKDCLNQINSYEDSDKSIQVDLIYGSEDETHFDSPMDYLEVVTNNNETYVLFLR